MSLVALIHPGQTFQVCRERIVSQCDLFNNPALVATPDMVRSSTVLAVFRDFVRQIETELIDLNKSITLIPKKPLRSIVWPGKAGKRYRMIRKRGRGTASSRLEVDGDLDILNRISHII
jgi:hypothetical protein